MFSYNEAYEKAIESVGSLNKKGEGLYGHLHRFVMDEGVNGETALKDSFRNHEKHASVDFKVEMGKNSTYRVVKNLFIKCMKHGIPLAAADGTPRGKTALELDVKEAEEASKTPKSEAEKFRIALNTAANIGNKLSPTECVMAAALVDDLFKVLADRVPRAA